MSTNIQLCVERRIDGRWEMMPRVNLHAWRSNRVFAFLASVNNYAGVTPIAPPRGFPEDVSPEVRELINDCTPQVVSWLARDELCGWNYDALVEDRTSSTRDKSGRRVMREVGKGVMMTWRKFLGDGFADGLQALKGIDPPADVRVVFGFYVSAP